jgi:SAM-dependent methyltransferase
MHPTAMINAKNFFSTYSASFAAGKSTKVLEIGSQDVNGSIRSACPAQFDYIGADFVSGKGVDIVLDDPYSLPFEPETFDIVLSSSCFEHSEMFWIAFLEIMRVLKPAGLFYLNVPSNGGLHRYPVDCWRFYPDSGDALVAWAERNGFNPVLLENYTSDQHLHQWSSWVSMFLKSSNKHINQWNDCVSIFLKDKAYSSEHKRRILDNFNDFVNGKIFGREGPLRIRKTPEDRLSFMARARWSIEKRLAGRRLPDQCL